MTTHAQHAKQSTSTQALPTRSCSQGLRLKFWQAQQPKLYVAPMSLQSSMMLCIFVTPSVDAKVTHLGTKGICGTDAALYSPDVTYMLPGAIKCVLRRSQSICCASVIFSALQGKVLMLITNSDYHYTNKMMSFAYNRFMPPGSTWRDLFDMVGIFYHYTTKVLHDGIPSASKC